jgi:hypothetical protein
MRREHVWLEVLSSCSSPSAALPPVEEASPTASLSALHKVDRTASLGLASYPTSGAWQSGSGVGQNISPKFPIKRVSFYLNFSVHGHTIEGNEIGVVFLEAFELWRQINVLTACRHFDLTGFTVRCTGLIILLKRSVLVYSMECKSPRYPSKVPRETRYLYTTITPEKAMSGTVKWSGNRLEWWRWKSGAGSGKDSWS